MKIGIYLGYGPNVNLHQEGLGRYLGVLIKCLSESEQKLVLAMPLWMRDSFNELADEHNINLSKVDFVTESKVFLGYWVYKFLTGKKRKIKEKTKLNLKDFSSHIFNKICCFLLYYYCLPRDFWTLIIFILFLGPMVIVTISFLCAAFLVSFLALLFYCANIIIKKDKTMKAKEKIKKLEEKIKKLDTKIADLRVYAFRVMTGQVQRSLVNRINRQHLEVDIWYSPGIFWPEFNKIIGKKVVNVPDIVIKDYPIQWSRMRESTIENTLRCERTIIENQAFVVYSEYVKDELLVKRYGKKEDQICVIPHLVNDMSPYICLSSMMVSRYNDVSAAEKELCRHILAGSKKNVLRVDEYIDGFDLTGVRFLFYASQIRPHKNFLNLLKAYRMVLREEFIGIKLFLTAQNILAEEAKEIRLFIEENGLDFDVVFFGGLTAQQLAAFYHEAELVVNPTLYEGGFPFTFGEGMSVGTPSVMSDIPQVREEFGSNMDECLFNPYDYRDMAGKIIWGLEHKDELYEKQLPIFQRMYKRDAKQYVQEYMDAFTYFSRIKEAL